MSDRLERYAELVVRVGANVQPGQEVEIRGFNVYVFRDDLVYFDAGDFVYSLEAKRAWRERVRYHVPPRSPSLTQEAERTALAAYRKLACRDVGRVDLRAARSGLAYDALIVAIVDEARARWGI